MRTLFRFTKQYFAEIVVVLITIPALLPLFHPGFFTMHDDQQVARLYELDRALAAGQFPARWVSHLGFGYGYPLFIFYPPFVYYLGEVCHLLLGTTFIVSIKLVFAFAFLGAALAMFVWVKEHFGKTAGVVAAAFYTYAPYHAVDAYVRGALAELTAFVWLPLILWSTDRLIVKQESKHWLWLALWLALLMITHNLIFLPFFPLFLMYAGMLLLKTNRLQATRPQRLSIALAGAASYKLIQAIAVALGLSAFFWIPALSERAHTLVDSILLSELATYKLHFVYPSQLWNSLWGFGGSTAGPLDGMSFKIGKLHVILALIALPVWLFISKVKSQKFLENKLFYCCTVLLLSLISAFMTTQLSDIIWKVVTPLQYLQFPWRFLTFTTLFSSFLAGSAVAAVSVFTKSRFTIVVAAVSLLTLLFFPNFKLFQPQTYLDVDDGHYTSDEFLKWKISKTSFEFVPKGVKTIQELSKDEGTKITQLAITHDQIATQPFTLLSGKAEIEVRRNVPGLIRLEIKGNKDIDLRLNTFNFPGWEMRIDGEKTKIRSDNDLKLITVNIPSGQHMLEASFKNTPVRIIANLITLLTGALLFVKRRSIMK